MSTTPSIPNPVAAAASVVSSAAKPVGGLVAELVQEWHSEGALVLGILSGLSVVPGSSNAATATMVGYALATKVAQILKGVKV